MEKGYYLIITAFHQNASRKIIIIVINHVNFLHIHRILMKSFRTASGRGNSNKEGDNLENRIKEYRKQQKITQDDLARAVRVTRQTIISLENGKYNASLQLAYKIAKYFDVAIEDIFIFEEEQR